MSVYAGIQVARFPAVALATPIVPPEGLRVRGSDLERPQSVRHLIELRFRSMASPSERSVALKVGRVRVFTCRLVMLQPMALRATPGAKSKSGVAGAADSVGTPSALEENNPLSRQIGF